MIYYVAPFTFDFSTSLVEVDSGVTDVEVGVLYDALKEAQASETGILFGRIAAGSGLAELGGGVQVGLTVEFLGGWQLGFAPGAYIARVTGGNLVGGPGGDPIAYSAGVQTLLIQSAASTVVNVDSGGGSGGATPSQIATAVWSHGARALNGQQAQAIDDLAKINGLKDGVDVVVTPTSRTAGDVSQTITEAGDTVTVHRQ